MKNVLFFLFCLFTLNLAAQQITVTGNVTDVEEEPLLGVNVRISGTQIGTQTDTDGSFSLEARIGEALVFSYVGMKTEKVLIKDRKPVNVTMNVDAALDPVYITITNIPKSRRKATYGITALSAKDLEKNPDSDVVRKMVGKVAGAQITGVSGTTGSGTNFFIRSKSSINGDNQPLFIVDGVPFNTGTNDFAGFQGGGVVTTSRFLDLDPNNIAKVEVLKGLSATVLYGQQGRNGVVLITTKTGSFDEQAYAPNLPYSERVLKEQEEARTVLANQRTFEEEGYVSRYQESVKTILNSPDRFQAFRDMESLFGNDPSYYLDVYDRFERIDPEFAGKLLAYFPEVSNEDPEFLKVLAFKLEEQGSYGHALEIYKRVMEILPGSRQALRLMALALQNSGKELEALYWFKGISNPNAKEANGYELIVNSELRNLFATSPDLLKEFNVSRDELKFNTYDLRITADWDKSDINWDLNVIDPNLENCSPLNPETRSDGNLNSNDDYGHSPETYEQENILSGSYYIKLESAEAEEALLDPVFVKLTIFRNYGTPEQSAEIKLVRVSGDTKSELIGRIAVE